MKSFSQILMQFNRKYLDGNNSPQEYHSMKEEVEKDLIGLDLRLNGFKQDKSPIKSI